ncbi:hypothetical protein V6N12_063503 [Hibiscus sabdariffa]|uniref:Uncharacterized protein n=1 Tax=Hibiscus sabdariffa TaxID=183260 RepID=A0ABR2FBW9_9ROSI
MQQLWYSKHRLSSLLATKASKLLLFRPSHRALQKKRVVLQEEIRLAEWRIKQRQIICDVDMIIKELNTLGKRKMQDGNR